MFLPNAGTTVSHYRAEIRKHLLVLGENRNFSRLSQSPFGYVLDFQPV